MTPTPAPQLGSLDWRPASEHPELLAPVVRDAVRDRQLPAWVAPIDPALADTAAFCASYQVRLEVSANCVIVTGRRGDHSIRAAVLVRATDRADINHAVRKELGVRKISFAAMDAAVAETAMEYGGISPIGLPVDWPVLVDDQVAELAWIVIGSGVRGSKLAVPGRLPADLPGARLLPLAR